MKTYSVKGSEIKRERIVIDADGKVLGKLATEVAQILMGKGKAIFSRHLDTGDYVTVVNATKVRLTGNKLEQKTYHRHSGYAGGFKTTTLAEMMAAKPEFVIEHAVRGMLPQNKLGDAMIKKLIVHAGAAPGSAKTVTT
ncbi:MAG: 50S ribosomal protein L13 [Dehalococcoidia bacterium]|nr:50S ribosomal protein L13 [Dehalococcoidia bacterium]